ncbi:hypothetical protein OEA41_007658 [Lepraria neglecta]|uniref:Uncharacterized protein n=1 Tax=Lepraria neglecta TaxID=209136 RepID=A0AAD9ZG44_9LECA|nr:hypothetical protein OEA41_007658 [Lepraria neglecta]
MAAVAVRSHCDYSRDNGSLEQKTLPRKIGLDDGVGYISTEWMRRCARSCRGRDLALEKTTPVETSILSPGGTESTYPLHTEPPPSYYESIADLPPSYDLGEDFTSTQLASKRLNLPPAYYYIPQSIILPPEPMTAPDVDFGDTSNFRQAAGKKAKKTAKQVSQAKWADDGDGGSKDGGDGEENGEGGGGGSNGGDGGAGDGGGGGDDWDAWDTGKKNKKGKKAKEEEKKKQEEEEAKKKEEEEEAANNDNPLSWADEVNGDVGDDWGGFTTTTKKDKKGKKVKVSQE